MIRRVFSASLFAIVLSLSGVLSTTTATDAVPTVAAVVVPIPMFSTEAAAQAHCPADVVVWLNIPTGIYHERGMRWYGRTKHGAFVCRKEADNAGYRDTRNGQ